MNKSTFARTTCAAAMLALGSASSAMGAGPCPPDINCSGAVNIDDLVAVITTWGSTAPIYTDVDGSGIVDIDDLVQVITHWGPCTFNFGPLYPNAEAQQIGLEMLGSIGPLTLPQAMYDRIDRDLTLIRNAFPGLVGQTHSMAWAPNQLIVGLQIAPAHPSFDCLNTYYQVTSNQLLFTSGSTQYRLLTFAGKVNVNALGPIYDALGDVTSAEPNGLVGGQNFWTPSLLINTNWRWTIDDGFLDCFDGCDCHRAYVIDTTTAGAVNLVSYQEYGQSWCDFGTP